jgi:phage FluMu protein Com
MVFSFMSFFLVVFVDATNLPTSPAWILIQNYRNTRTQKITRTRHCNELLVRDEYSYTKLICLNCGYAFGRLLTTTTTTLS